MLNPPCKHETETRWQYFAWEQAHSNLLLRQVGAVGIIAGLTELLPVGLTEAPGSTASRSVALTRLVVQKFCTDLNLGASTAAILATAFERLFAAAAPFTLGCVAPHEVAILGATPALGFVHGAASTAAARLVF